MAETGAGAEEADGEDQQGEGGAPVPAGKLRSRTRRPLSHQPPPSTAPLKITASSSSPFAASPQHGEHLPDR